MISPSLQRRTAAPGLPAAIARVLVEYRSVAVECFERTWIPSYVGRDSAWAWEVGYRAAGAKDDYDEVMTRLLGANPMSFLEALGVAGGAPSAERDQPRGLAADPRFSRWDWSHWRWPP